MPEEIIVPENTDESHAEEEATDAELSAALDEMLNGTTEQVADEEPEPHPEPEKKEKPHPTEEELEEQRERSSLGRKVAKYAEEVSELKSTILSLNQKLEGLGKKPVEDFDEYGEPRSHDEFDLTTPEGVDRYMDHRERQKQERIIDNQRVYEQKYVSVMQDLLSDIDNTKLRDLAQAELVKKGGQFNVRLSDDPSHDCAKNLNGALKHLRTTLKPATVFDKQGRAINVPAGVSGGASTVKGAVKQHNLDEYESSVSKGMSAEEIDDALTGEEKTISLKRNHERMR